MSATHRHLKPFAMLIFLPLGLAACGHDWPPAGWDRDAGGPDGGWEDQPLEIVHLDVGQGDATLIIGPEGQTLLFDAGPADATAALDAVFSSRGIVRLDFLFISHTDADHFAGLIPLVEKGLAVRQAFVGGAGEPSALFGRLQSAIGATAAAEFSRPRPAQTFDLGAGALATCTAVDGQILGGGQVVVTEDNDRCLALQLRYGGFDYHLGGDLGGGGLGQADVEAALGPLIGDQDVVHLHHHGSASSTNAAWLNATSPEVTIVSVGENNYGHPAELVVNRLRGGDPAVVVGSPIVFQTGAGARFAGTVLGTFSLLTDGGFYAIDGSCWEVDE